MRRFLLFASLNDKLSAIKIIKTNCAVEISLWETYEKLNLLIESDIQIRFISRRQYVARRKVTHLLILAVMGKKAIEDKLRIIIF